jgi:hypothetical protein
MVRGRRRQAKSHRVGSGECGDYTHDCDDSDQDSGGEDSGTLDCERDPACHEQRDASEGK